MNEMNFILTSMFNSLVNQAIVNREKQWQQLPQDQQEAQDKMLNAIHDLFENNNKILPQYRQQVLEAMALKIMSEMQKPIGG